MPPRDEADALRSNCRARRYADLSVRFTPAGGGEKPVRAQPRRAEGTLEHPYTALNLRLGLALFGFVVSVVAAVILFRADLAVAGVLMVALAVVAVVDIVVVQLRRRARRRAPRDA